MKKITNQKGITLIALIITIIVMLILVGVTINVALNGGLFQKAKNSSNQMQIEADKEELLSAVLGAYDEKTDKIDGQKLKHTLESNGWTVNISSTPYICKSSKDNLFNVDIHGNITVAQNNGGQATPVNNTVPDDLEKYILGEDKQGRNLREILNDDDLDNGYTDNSVSNLGAIFEEITDKLVLYLYIGYNNDGNMYRFKTEGTSFDISTWETKPISEEEKIKVISVSDKNIGKELTLNGVEYIVLYGEGEKTEGAQLITKYAIQKEGNNINLSFDELAFPNATFIPYDENKTKNDANPHLDLEKQVYAYNNAVKRLNDICSELIMDEEIEDVVSSIRSVGSNPINNPTQFVTSPVNPYTSNYLKEEWPANDTYYNIGVGDGIAEDRDNNFLEDYDRLFFLGKTSATLKNGNDNVRYWLASHAPGTLNFDTYMDFDIRRVSNDGGLSSDAIWNMNTNGVTSTSSFDYAVRPVVTLKANTLNGLLGQ